MDKKQAIFRPLGLPAWLREIPEKYSGGSLRSDATDDEDIVELLPRFIGDLPALVSRLSGLLRQRDGEELGEVIHQLKGTAGVYGFMQLTESAARIEPRLWGKPITKTTTMQMESLIQTIRCVEGYDRQKETPQVDGRITSEKTPRSRAA